jgi:hypothetical protein
MKYGRWQMAHNQEPSENINLLEQNQTYTQKASPYGKV